MRKFTLLAALAACLVAALGISAPASAQTQQTGLINVNLDDITVQVPVSVAANICGLNVSALAVGVAQGGVVSCTAESDAGADATASRDPAPTTQEGLVNVNVEDVTVQIPVALAANVCGLNLAILAVDVLQGTAVECEARARGIAKNR